MWYLNINVKTSRSQKRWCKKPTKLLYYTCILEIRIENFTTRPHLYRQPTSRSVKSLKRKLEKLHNKYVFAPADKAANTS